MAVPPTLPHPFAPQRPLYRSKKESVLDALRSAIVGGQYLPGQKLVIDEMAAQFGISAIPIREALQQLQADGLVKIEPHVGATVTPIESNLVEEIFDLLEALELMSARRAVGSRMCCAMSPGWRVSGGRTRAARTRPARD